MVYIYLIRGFYQIQLNSKTEFYRRKINVFLHTYVDFFSMSINKDNHIHK